MNRFLFSVVMVIGSVGLRDARAQSPGEVVVYQTVVTGQVVVYGERYRVGHKHHRAQSLTYVVSQAPVVSEMRVIQPVPIVERRVIQPAPIVEERVIQPAPIVERRIIQQQPVVQTRYFIYQN